MQSYEDLVVNVQQKNYSRYYSVYAQGGTPYVLSERAPLTQKEAAAALVAQIEEADCVLVGGASGLSAAGGGDFYYGDTPSYRKYFGKFAEKYHFQGAFSGMQYPFPTREEFWGYLATFLHTTQQAPLRQPYMDLDVLLKGKTFHVLTTNQDTQFVKIYPEHQVSEIQGDHRFFQCSRCCSDDTWDAVAPVSAMVASMGDGTEIDPALLPRCPHCGAEAFPWVRGYGNFLQGRKYDAEYQKVTDFISAHENDKLLFLELGVGRLTPMFIQEPFWHLTAALPQARYVGVNDRYAFLPEDIEDCGLMLVSDIGTLLHDAAALVQAGAAQ